MRGPSAILACQTAPDFKIHTNLHSGQTQKQARCLPTREQTVAASDYEKQRRDFLDFSEFKKTEMKWADVLNQTNETIRSASYRNKLQALLLRQAIPREIRTQILLKVSGALELIQVNAMLYQVISFTLLRFLS